MRIIKRAAITTLVISSLAFAPTMAQAVEPSFPTPEKTTPVGLNFDFTNESTVRPIGVDVNGDQLTIDSKTLLGTYNVGASAASSNAYVPNGVSSEQISASSIIGSDNRSRITATKTFPSRAVVYITYNGKQHCTGWMISKNTLITAGHCLYNHKAKSWYNTSKFAFYPGRNAGTSPYGSAKATKVWTDTSYITSGNQKQDWGIIKLNKNIGNTTGWFGLKWQSASYNGTKVTVRGYPSDKKAGQLWTMSGKITSSKANNLCYSIDTYGGQSGSPIYLSNNQVIGIHTNGTVSKRTTPCAGKYNQGVRITKSLYNIIMDVK